VRRVWILCLWYGALLLPASVARAEEAPAETRAFVEVRAEPASVHVGEVFDVHVRFGLDAAWFDAHAVPLFRQAMDIPVQLGLSWADDLEGARDPDQPWHPAEGQRFVLNDTSAEAARIGSEERAGRSWRLYEWTRRFEASAPGELTLAAPTLRFAWSTRFEDDFVGGRVALDRQDSSVQGNALTLPVRALPEEGRPPDFGGAVGRFEVEARVDEAPFAESGSILVHLTIRGAGNLWTFAPPTFPADAGFHLVGRREARGAETRTITYEVAPTAPTVRSLPSLALPYFDPTPPGAYRRAQSAALPIDARAATRAPEEVQGPAAGADADPPAAPRSFDPRPLAVFLFLVLLGVLLWHRLRRAQHPGPAETVAAAETGAVADPAAQEAARRQREARQAQALLAARAALGTPEALDALLTWLALRLDTSPGALVGPALGTRLEEAGCTPALAARVAALVRAHVAARYGGPKPDARIDAALLQALVDTLGTPARL
jgi:hypothetical protein